LQHLTFPFALFLIGELLVTKREKEDNPFIENCFPINYNLPGRLVSNYFSGESAKCSVLPWTWFLPAVGSARVLIGLRYEENLCLSKMGQTLPSCCWNNFFTLPQSVKTSAADFPIK
jgi:hypothetical protein